MLKRAITGSVFVIVLIGCTYWSPFSVFALFIFFVIIGSWEYLKILDQNSESKPNKKLGVFTAFLFFLSLTAGITLNITTDKFLAVTILSAFTIPLLELYTKSKNPFNNIVHTIFPVIYIALPFALLLLANHKVNLQAGYNPSFILGYYFILWSNDTGAYLIGKAFGKRKLFERISPNKTWEGSIGGAFLAITTALIVGYFFELLPLWQWASIGLIIAIIGSMGDLVESLFKRSMNVKDSGKIMPGHGGVLDRFDGLLFSAPFVYAFILLVN